jgi:hypothetical protein
MIEIANRFHRRIVAEEFQEDGPHRLCNAPTASAYWMRCRNSWKYFKVRAASPSRVVSIFGATVAQSATNAR